MIVSAARPYFCPYPAYVARIMASDVFVVLDDVQFPRGSSWITRNRFKNDQGTLWLRVPVRTKGLGLQKISEVRACPDPRWRGKLLMSLHHAYLHAPYRDEFMAVFEEVFRSEEDRLLSINMRLLARALDAVGCTARVVMLSEMGLCTKGPALPGDICTELGATVYLTGTHGRPWIDENRFRQAGIEVRYMRPANPVYPQLWGDFIPGLSVYDLLFVCGPKASDYIRGTRTAPTPHLR